MQSFIECNINILRKYITAEHLKNKLRLKFGYSNSKGLLYKIQNHCSPKKKKTTRTPVSILIHPGAPNDSQNFDTVLKRTQKKTSKQTKRHFYTSTKTNSHTKTIKYESTYTKSFQ